MNIEYKLKLDEKRIVPCLDTMDGKLVKGERFEDIKYIGDPLEFAKKYDKQGVDEIVFLDIAPKYEQREKIIGIIRGIANQISIPLIYGGGIRSIDDIKDMLNAGADKVSINTAAVKNPELLKEASQKFGSQCIVIAIDAKKENEGWGVYIEGGKKSAGLDAIEWSKRAESLGAGEILLTSIDKDGTKEGYDIELIRKVAEAVNIPVIASGGAGKIEDIYEVLTKGKADAALIASIVHYNQCTIKQIKDYLTNRGVLVK